MKRLLFVCLLCGMLLLCGCASLLTRQYNVVTPSSDDYWENEDASTLRAENYQELVNDLLILVSARADSGQVRMYGYESMVTAEEDVKQACREVQVETALGSYALDYITFQCSEETGFFEADILLQYRRTPEQQQQIVQTSSTEAIDDLLTIVAQSDSRKELVVSVSYAAATREEIREKVLQVQRAFVPDAPADWVVHFYPAEGAVEIVEILLESEAEELPAPPSEEPVPPVEESEEPVEESEEPVEESEEPVEESEEPIEKNEDEGLTTGEESGTINTVPRA